MHISSNYREPFRIVASVLGGFSFLCSLFFVYVYTFSRSSGKFYLKLVFYLQVSDCIQAFGVFLTPFTELGGDQSFCKFQAFLLQFGLISSLLWRASISIIMYISIKKGAEKAEAQEIRLLLFLFWITLLLSIIPFCSEDYKHNDVWCWINRDNDLMIYLLLYLELWISILIILVITILVARHLKRESRKGKIKKFRQKIKYYPFVVIIIWLVPSVDRIINSCYREFPIYTTIFGFFHILAYSVQGCANFFLYGSDYVWKVFRKKRLEEEKVKEKSLMKFIREPQLPIYTQLIFHDKQSEQRIADISDDTPSISEN